MVVTPQFQNVGNGNFSLLNFSASEAMYDNLTVNQIDEYGTSVHTYSWTTSADDGSGSYDKTGWADDDYLLVTDPDAVEFLPGESVVVYSGVGALQSAGQVRKADATIQLRNGFTLAGNPFPVTLHVKDLLPSSTEGIEDTYDQITLNIIDESGVSIHTYTWTTSADDGSGNYDKIGWADDDYMIINADNDITIGPGEGVEVYGSSTNHYLTFPAPEL